MLRPRLVLRLLRPVQCHSVRCSSSASEPVRVRYSAPAPRKKERLEDPSRPSEGTRPSDIITAYDGRKHQFHRYYLSLSPNRGPLLVSTWTQALPARNAQISSSLNQHPLEVFHTTDADLDLVAACLELVVARAVRASNSKEEERAFYLQQKPGTRALHWLVAGALEKHDLSQAQQFLRAMIHCIVAEGQESHLWSWLSIEHTPEYMRSWTRFEMRTWRGEVVRWLVESATYWAPGGPNLQQGLLVYVQARERAEFGGVPNLPTGAARAWLLKQVSGPFGNTNSIPRDLFEKFMSIAVQDDRSRFEKARMMLKYPGEPRPDLGLDVLRASKNRDSRPPYMKNLVEADDGPKLTCFHNFVLNVARALRDQGRMAEAREALDIGRDLAPSYFGGAAPRIDWRTRARQTHRRPIEAWSSYGLEASEDGSIKESALRQRQAEAAYKVEAEERQRQIELRRQQAMKSKELRQRKSSRR
ncbi:hypothetical protein PRZ48_010621 [Zasmidium cellare]|uniref:Uncharacterized protein n=1 Tax=Zasmidium cellare TaxID=395010 RepID=A0ABR0E9Q6_ZASCE|nr:hypothetical protein PRZ48_010621 [Zasmidium cellare]